uniref:Small COPII coat GTPase SAR1 n=1 Tax=Coccolithus braarudii TaxID=221442 RepID=A0A7S0QAG1_9EUKA|mmetsp:Transcript_5283/g.11595  ORF Transcript_5283/g.11595 Transcript_5283/m.11595 type:complete len:257 (+) Transcript_5283:38-808(+)
MPRRPLLLPLLWTVMILECAMLCSAERAAILSPTVPVLRVSAVVCEAASEQFGACNALVRLRGGSMMETWRGIMRGWLAKLGIFTKKGQLLVIGLDNAGKSTLLTMLLENKVVPHEPTHQPVTDEIKVGSLKLRAVDMGGHAIARRMWRQYSQEADAVVFIVDSADRERFQEAALELHKLLAGNSLPQHAPVLILGNKVDLPGAVREEELYWSLGLDALSRGTPNAPARPLQLYMCSVFEGRGFPEGLEWLASCVK